MENRVYLKQLKMDEINERVLSWFEDFGLMKFYTNSQKKITKNDLQQSILNGEKVNTFTYGIYFKENDLLIGTIKLGPIHSVHNTSDLVALIGDRDYLGKGLAVDAIKQGNTLAFNKFNVRRLQGGMYASNIPSIKAYTRAGWVIEGVLKGFYQVQGNNEDRVLVSCLNPKFFTNEEILELKEKEAVYVKYKR